MTHLPPHTLSDARSGLLALKRGGWTMDAINVAPWFALSDWLRDNGHEAGADALGEPGAHAHVRYWAGFLYG